MEGEQGTTNARLSRLETKYDELVQTVARVELNQKHAEELNRLRFDALDLNQKTLTTQVSEFIKRIDGLISGETEMPRQRDLMADWVKWRGEVEADREAQAVRNGRIDLVAKVVYGLVGGNVVAIAGAILWVASGNHI
jgi:hypothetical protein